MERAKDSDSEDSSELEQINTQRQKEEDSSDSEESLRDYSLVGDKKQYHPSKMC